MQLPVEKERCNVEWGVFVDLVPKCMQTRVPWAHCVGGEGAARWPLRQAVKRSQCLEVGESRREGEVGEGERDR